MKNILLSSAAIALLAGAASAEVTWSGDAELGYNDEPGLYDGFYYDLGLTLGLSQELNNGWTASVTADIDFTSAEYQTTQGTGLSFLDATSTSDIVLTLSNDVFALTYGDVETVFTSFDLVNDFYEPVADEAEDFLADVSVLKAEADFGAYSVGVSTFLSSDFGPAAEDFGIQFFASAELGMVDLGFFYAEEDTTYADYMMDSDYEQLETILLSAKTSLGGAELTFNAGTLDGDAGYGLAVAYPVGPVTIGANVNYAEAYAEEMAYGVNVAYSDGPISIYAYYEDAYNEEEFGVAGSYDMGNGLVVTAGTIDGDDDTDNDFASYIVAEYDLGGGASFLASYADATSYDKSGDLDDIDTSLGGYELNYGATLALSFEF